MNRLDGHVLPQFPTLLGLSPSQELALGSLLTGSTVTAAAQAAGVDRTTVHRWLIDPTFRDEYERRRNELQATIRDRLVGMASKAADALERALDNGDAKSALILLRGLGLLADDPAVTVNVAGSSGGRPMEPLNRAQAEKQLRDMLRQWNIPMPDGFQFPSPWDMPVEIVRENSL